MADEAVPPTACPVDHKTRTAWLEKAKAQTEAEKAQKFPSPIGPTDGCDSNTIDQTPPATKSSLPIPSFLQGNLATDREISTIPRANSDAAPGQMANNEQETGSDKTSGNWIYPSEQMFFNAMRRKNYDPRIEDMKSIVPIHNAVNERAWQQIKEWEKGRGSEKCGGPRLVSFKGDATAMTPKARINTLLGYTAPFDRHDWVVDRCGTNVEYVIDFYAGKDEGKAGKSLNLYLDVRPKLNTFEGWKMRAEKLFGL